MRKAYPSDLTDDQWVILEPLIPPAKTGGAPRTVNLREVLNTLFYQNRAGCQWQGKQEREKRLCRRAAHDNSPLLRRWVESSGRKAWKSSDSLV